MKCYLHWFIFFGYLTVKTLSDKKVNVALETVFEFHPNDEDEDLRMIGDLQGVLKTVKKSVKDRAKFRYAARNSRYKQPEKNNTAFGKILTGEADRDKYNAQVQEITHKDKYVTTLNSIVEINDDEDKEKPQNPLMDQKTIEAIQNILKKDQKTITTLKSTHSKKNKSYDLTFRANRWKPNVKHIARIIHSLDDKDLDTLVDTFGSEIRSKMNEKANYFRSGYLTKSLDYLKNLPKNIIRGLLGEIASDTNKIDPVPEHKGFFGGNSGMMSHLNDAANEVEITTETYEFNKLYDFNSAEEKLDLFKLYKKPAYSEEANHQYFKKMVKKAIAGMMKKDNHVKDIQRQEIQKKLKRLWKNLNDNGHPEDNYGVQGTRERKKKEDREVWLQLFQHPESSTSRQVKIQSLQYNGAIGHIKPFESKYPTELREDEIENYPDEREIKKYNKEENTPKVVYVNETTRKIKKKKKKGRNKKHKKKKLSKIEHEPEKVTDTVKNTTTVFENLDGNKVLSLIQKFLNQHQKEATITVANKRKKHKKRKTKKESILNDSDKNNEQVTKERKRKKKTKETNSSVLPTETESTPKNSSKQVIHPIITEVTTEKFHKVVLHPIMHMPDSAAKEMKRKKKKPTRSTESTITTSRTTTTTTLTTTTERSFGDILMHKYGSNYHANMGVNLKQKNLLRYWKPNNLMDPNLKVNSAEHSIERQPRAEEIMSEGLSIEVEENKGTKTKNQAHKLDKGELKVLEAKAEKTHLGDTNTRKRNGGETNETTINIPTRTSVKAYERLLGNYTFTTRVISLRRSANRTNTVHNKGTKDIVIPPQIYKRIDHLEKQFKKIEYFMEHINDTNKNESKTKVTVTKTVATRNMPIVFRSIANNNTFNVVNQDNAKAKSIKWTTIQKIAPDNKSNSFVSYVVTDTTSNPVTVIVTDPITKAEVTKNTVAFENFTINDTTKKVYTTVSVTTAKAKLVEKNVTDSNVTKSSKNVIYWDYNL